MEKNRDSATACRTEDPPKRGNSPLLKQDYYSYTRQAVDLEEQKLYSPKATACTV